MATASVSALSSTGCGLVRKRLSRVVPVDLSAPEATVDKVLRMMPSQKLIRHEWEKHGTCSGLSAEQYFQQVETVFAGLKIPSPYQSPTAPVVTSLAELKELPRRKPAACRDQHHRPVFRRLSARGSHLPAQRPVADAVWWLCSRLLQSPEVQLRPLRLASSTIPSPIQP